MLKAEFPLEMRPDKSVSVFLYNKSIICPYGDYQTGEA
jgi:hypothetical protein